MSILTDKVRKLAKVAAQTATADEKAATLRRARVLAGDKAFLRVLPGGRYSMDEADPDKMLPNA